MSGGGWRRGRRLRRLGSTVIAAPPTPSRPRRLLIGAFAVVAVVALAAGCTYGGTPGDPGALEVGDTRLLVSELNDEMDYFVANPSAAQSLLGVDVSLIATGGQGADAQRRQLAVGVLNVHAYAALLSSAAADRGVVPGAEDEAGAAQTLASLNTAAVPPPPSLQAVIEVLVANQLALTRALEAEQAPVTDEDVRAAYDAAVADASRFEGYSCSSHILVAFGATGAEPTPDEDAAALASIEAVAARLDAGEDFATVAAEVSDDPGSGARGGDLGCNFPGTFVPEFEAALDALAPGELSAPVRTEFGYHIIRLDSRGVPPFDKVSEQIRSELESNQTDVRQQLTQLLTEKAADTEVIVNPRYGTWDAAQVAVVPPSGAAPAPTLPTTGGFDLESLGLEGLPAG